jgi:hypothetical protein
MAFETVEFVWDYYDGPREGFARWNGKPVHFAFRGNCASDHLSDTFVVTPLEDDDFKLALERQGIWCEWDQAFRSGLTEWGSHPANPGQNAKFAELSARLKSLIEGKRSFRTRAVFRATRGKADLSPGVLRNMEVRWIPDPGDTDPAIHIPGVLNSLAQHGIAHRLVSARSAEDLCLTEWTERAFPWVHSQIDWSGIAAHEYIDWLELDDLVQVFQSQREGWLIEMFHEGTLCFGQSDSRSG